MDNVVVGHGHHHVNLRRPNATSLIEFPIFTLSFCSPNKFLKLTIRRAPLSPRPLRSVGIGASPVLVPVRPVVPIRAQVREEWAPPRNFFGNWRDKFVVGGLAHLRPAPSFRFRVSPRKASARAI